MRTGSRSGWPRTWSSIRPRAARSPSATATDERFGTVETVEEGERFAFTWSRPGEGESFVEFTIEALPGGSRVTVVETPTRSAATNTAAGSTAMAAGGWGPRLARLQRSMSFVLVA